MKMPSWNSITESWTTKAAVLIVIVGLGINYYERGLRPFSAADMDESCWVSCTYYYHLAFKRGDLGSKDWMHLDCIDHPPLMKFLLGATIDWGAGFTVTDLTLREKWDSFPSVMDSSEFYRDRIPDRVFALGRLLNTIFMMGAGIILYFIARQAFSPMAGLLAVSMFVSSPLIQFLATYLNADSLLILLLSAATLVQIKWIRMVLTQNRWVTWSIVLGLTNGLLFNAKIWGVIMVPTEILSMIAIGFLSRNGSSYVHKKRSIVFAVTTLALVSFITAVSINPSLYSHPVRFFSTMLAHRSKILEIQKAVSPQILAFPNEQIRLGTFALILDYVGTRPGSIPLVLFNMGREQLREQEPTLLRTARDLVPICAAFFFIAGIVRYPTAIRARPIEAGSLGITIFVCVIATYYSFQLNVPRYLGMTFPSVLLVTGFGCWIFFADLLKFRPPSATTIARTILIFAITLYAVFFSIQWNSDVFLRDHPGWAEEREKNRRPLEEYDREILLIHSRVRQP